MSFDTSPQDHSEINLEFPVFSFKRESQNEISTSLLLMALFVPCILFNTLRKYCSNPNRDEK